MTLFHDNDDNDDDDDNNNNNNNTRSEGKDVPVHVITAHRGSGGIAPLNPNLSGRWR